MSDNGKRKTPKELARIVLNIYGTRNATPGTGLRMTQFLMPMHLLGLHQADTDAGVAFAKEAGWLKDGPLSSFVLTDRGFKAMP